MISLGFFYIFSKSNWIVRGAGEKFCLLYTISREPYIMWLSFMVYICKMVISPGFFFHFFKILVLQIVSAVKWQKVTQSDKKLYLLLSLSQEPYIIWLSVMVHMCKMIICKMIKFSGVFFNFSKFWFSKFSGGGRAKNGAKWQKNLTVAPYISGVIHHIFIYGTHI